MTVIQKFGGAAMADGRGILNAAGIIANEPRRKVVVASAMAGVTDALIQGIQDAMLEEGTILPLIDALRRKHMEALNWIAHEAKRDVDQSAHYSVSVTLERLERLLYGISYTQELTPRLQDLVQSFGERLSVPILAAALRALDLDAVHLDAEHAPVLTLGPFQRARPDHAGLNARLRPRLERHMDADQIVVLTGYYGVDGEGHATLFGRGGSDYVATLIGSILQVEEVQLWKDVRGFLSADPNLVQAARVVRELSYQEAAELAHLGARVLHPRAVEPVEEQGIPIRILCFQDPAGPGSTLRPMVAPEAGFIRSVASRPGIAMIEITGAGMAYTSGVAARVFEPLKQAGINVLNMATSQATFALLLEEKDADAAVACLKGLVGGVIRGVRAIHGRTIVCVVGEGLGQQKGSAAKILQTVSEAGVNIEMISLGASPIAIDFVVKSEDRERAVQAIHQHLMVVPA